MVIQRGLANGAGPYHVVGFGGWSPKVAWEGSYSYVNGLTYLGGISGYDGVISSTAAGSNLGTKSEDGLSIVSDYGVGSPGSISANTVINSPDHKGSVGGTAYVRIEAYVNA
jgi:hypothetical protein